MQRHTPLTATHPRQGGAVIIVVVSLMTTLAFLGLFFYNWTSQERSNAEYFASADPVEIDPDPIFDLALRQAIVGPRPASETQSALHGAHHALLASVLGVPRADSTNDTLHYAPHPYSGRGAIITFTDGDGDGLPDPDFDIDGDMTADVATQFDVWYGGTQRNEDNFVLNFSPAANGGTTGHATGDEYEPHTGYTYPDINSLWLAFDEEVTEIGGAASHRIVIPSYHRPQYFLDRRVEGNVGFDAHTSTITSGSVQGIYEEDGSGTAPSTQLRVLRPHKNHRSVDATSQNRFRSTQITAESGDRTRLIEAFPFERDYDNDNNANEAGVFTAEAVADMDNYEYDGDVDRDGMPDSVLIDLGHPLIDLPGGRQVVPMFLFKWIDADGLLNVNAHGNMEGLLTLQRTLNTTNNPNDEWLSESNLGMSSFEVNLAAGLTQDPTTLSSSEKTQHRAMMNANPADSFELANLELLMLLSGRMDYSNDASTLRSNTEVVGRYGEAAGVRPFVEWCNANLLSATPDFVMTPPSPPLAGRTGDDDDIDNYVTDFGQPLDYLGVGDATDDSPGGNMSGVDAAPGRVRRLQSLGGGAAVPQYNANWLESLYSGLGASYQPSPLAAATMALDESDEAFLEPGLRVSADAVFPASEMFALHGSESDHASVGVNSRLWALASGNFRDGDDAVNIRRRFTTDSWDRLNFAVTPELSGDQRDWEFNTWTDGGGGNFVEASAPDETFTRAFPPEFGPGGVRVGVFSAEDPFRGALRRLLTTRTNLTSDTEYHALRSLGYVNQRLNINRFLEANPLANGAPRYERLIEHPTGLGSAPITTGDELTARRERQRMARDLYVMLYLLGGGQDSRNYASESNAGGALYDDETLKEMAQFCVNVVDSLDKDNVFTRFEYDKDLSNGWNVDDNPYDASGDSDREVVIGVEAQDLTLSEAMFVFCHEASSGTDNPDTEWDDSEIRSFAYIELRNAGPYTINVNDYSWQILLEIESLGHSRELTLQKGNIAGGGLYTIGTAGDDHNQNMGTVLESFMRADTGAGMDTVVPKSAALDLDLITDDPNADYWLADPASRTTRITTLGDFFPPSIAEALQMAPTEIKLTLRRRTNLNRTMPVPAGSSYNQAENDDNPWVTVDEMTINAALPNEGFADFDVDGTLADELDELRTRERPHPFDRRGELGHASDNASDPPKPNSLGLDNDRTGATDLWQPHFDRDFASLIDLFAIPLYGPDELTDRFAEGSGAGARMSGFSKTTPGGNPKPAVAGQKFMNPEHPDNVGAMSPDETLNNRWYRLLEFLHVVPQNLATIGDSTNGILPFPRRTPGRINVNMVRHESVLAGLIDDAIINRNGALPTQQVGFDTARNWYDALRVTRDSIDTFVRTRTAGTGDVHLPIPGNFGSRPMRSFSTFFQLAEPDVVDNLFMRDFIDYDPSTWNYTRYDIELFEARAISDVGADQVDYHTRHRLLSKILNNSTTRSHVFAGWIEIRFHEAHVRDPSGTPFVQVGAEASDLPTYRQFVVVDMSRLEEAYNETNDTFDFRKFIIHRQNLP